MASTQVDRFNASVPTAAPDMAGSTVEHVSSGSLPQIQDANLLREAALKSRRARKQAITQTQPTQETSVIATGGDGDILMEDATTRTKADTEDGEILENSRPHNTGGTDAFGVDAREKTPRPLSDVSNNQVKAATGTEEPQYVRPGLKMTARDLDEAKRLILDLLGLGVKPEYLVDCGVSPQCLAVCFYEMNLRFPLNLDRRQINLPPFYDLEKHMKDSQRREQIIRQRDRNQVAPALISVAAPSTSGSGNSPALSRTTSSDPSSPSKKDSLADTSRAVREYTSPTPPDSNGERPLDSPSNNVYAVSATSTPPTGVMTMVDSSTIEDQKRMELLARKAAMESITRKRAARPLAASATSESRRRDVQLSQLEIQDVASAVDELLASVRMDSASSVQSEDVSSKYGDHASTGSGELLPDYDSDAMVEDELEARSLSFSDAEGDDKAMDPTSFLGHQRNLSPEHISPDASASIPSPRPASRVRFEAPGPARSSSLPVQPVPIAVPVVARRSRPIASDFIDQTPPRPASAPRNEPERTAPLKRKRSFVDPSVWPKRLVIDLDSSDEEGEDEDDTGAHPSTSNPSVPSSKANTDGPPSRNGSHEKLGNDGHLAAQMLLEKELQIKAMMQKIKMREQQKKKSASGTGTPVLPPANVATISSTGENSKTQTLNAGPVSAAVSIVSSPKVLIATTTPLPTPKFEIPLELASGADAQQASIINDEGVTAHKVDKGKGKATEFEEDSTGGSQDVTKDVSAVTAADGKAELGLTLNWESEKQAPTHFKAYTSPLIGFTSPNLQRAGPTDQQLSTMYWISSTAGQHQDINRQLCQYEFPSGICKDRGCKDIHMRDFGASDDEIWKTATSMFPNAGPVGLNEIVARVRQSVQAQS